MALNTTTLSSAVAVTDNSIVVASATGAAPGTLVRIDSEFMKIAQSYVSGTTIPVIRGQDGSVTSLHRSSTNVTFGLASDFQPPPSGLELSVTNPVTPAVGQIYSYSTSGAIAPVAGIHVLNGTSTLTMTLTNPTKDQDGTILFVVANGKAASTLAVGGTLGIGNGGSTMDVGTFATTEQTGCAFMAINGFWVLWANGIGSTGTQVAGVVFA
jgi:hypothetical protein